VQDVEQDSFIFGSLIGLRFHCFSRNRKTIGRPNKWVVPTKMPELISLKTFDDNNIFFSLSLFLLVKNNIERKKKRDSKNMM